MQSTHRRYQDDCEIDDFMDYSVNKNSCTRSTAASDSGERHVGIAILKFIADISGLLKFIMIILLLYWCGFFDLFK